MTMRKKIGVHFPRNFAVNLDEIQYVATTCWFIEAHAKFILHKYYSRGITLPMRCNEIRLLLTLSCVGTLANRFVSNLVRC